MAELDTGEILQSFLAGHHELYSKKNIRTDDFHSKKMLKYSRLTIFVHDCIVQRQKEATYIYWPKCLALV